MYDLVFAANPALDSALAEPEGLPPALAQRLRQAPLTALTQTYQMAREHHARGLVLCGQILAPLRASPAQVVAVRRLILEAAATGCETVWVTTDATAPREVLRMLGEPQGLGFATPLTPWTATIRAATVELWAVAAADDTERATASGAATSLHRRILVGGDSGPQPHAAAQRVFPASVINRPDTLAVWATATNTTLPAGVLRLPTLQPRSRHAVGAGASGLTLYQPSEAAANAGEMARQSNGWHRLPAEQVCWRSLQVESADGDAPAVAEQLWEVLSPPAAAHPAPATLAEPLTLVDCQIACGTSIERRIEIGACAVEATRLLRERCAAAAPSIWCERITAAADESLAALGHSRSGGQPGTSNSFTSALADIVTEREVGGSSDSCDREAAWLALELLEAD